MRLEFVRPEIEGQSVRWAAMAGPLKYYDAIAKDNPELVLSSRPRRRERFPPGGDGRLSEFRAHA
jgi:hypothetical protein